MVMENRMTNSPSEEAGGAVDSVTGNIVNNTDPTNPVVTQVQANWTEINPALPAYILNKPTIPTVGGNDTEVEFNDGGVLAGDPTFTFNKTTKLLTSQTHALSGATSGAVTLQAPLVAGSNTITLPINPVDGYLLSTNGSGTWNYTAALTPGGLAGQVQYNTGSGLGGISGASSDGTTLTTNNQVLNGTVSGTAVGTTAAASTLAQRDVSGNLSSNSIDSDLTSTASAAGTTTLTVASAQNQNLTGTSTQTYQLPVATTLRNGRRFNFTNNSTASALVNNAGGTLLLTLPTGQNASIVLLDNSTSNGTWEIEYKASAPANNNIVTATINSAYTINTASGNQFNLTIGGTTLLDIVSPPTAPAWSKIYVNLVGATGQRAAVINFGTGFAFEGGTPPAVSKGDQQVTTLELSGPDPITNEWRGVVLQNNVKLPNAQTGTTYSFTTHDNNGIVTASNSAAQTYTLPQDLTEAIPVGWKTFFTNKNVGIVSIANEGSDTTIGNTTFGPNASGIIEKIASGQYEVFGGTANVVMPALGPNTISSITNTTPHFVWRAQSACTLLGIYHRSFAVGVAGNFKLQLNGVDIGGLTGLAATTSGSAVSASSSVVLAANDIITAIGDGTLNTDDLCLIPNYTQPF